MKKSILLLLFLLCVSVPAHAITYYVDAARSDSNNCTQAQTIGTAKGTIQGGIGCLAAGGDTLKIVAGTYVETNCAGLGYTMPSGSAAAGYITITSNSGASDVIWQPTFGAQFCAFHLYNSQHHILMDHLVLDGQNGVATCGPGGSNPASGTCSNGIELGDQGTSATTSHDITVQNSEIKNFQGQLANGIFTRDFVTNFNLYNNLIHNNGTNPFGHGVYYEGSGGTITNNRIYSNGNGGIQVYVSIVGGNGANNNILKYNEIYSNNFGLAVKGANNTIRYNIIRDSTGDGVAIGYSGASCDGNIFDGNIVVRNGGNGLRNGHFVNCSNNFIRNNIITANTSGDLYERSGNSGTTCSNNRIINIGSGGVALATVCPTNSGSYATTDFVDWTSSNFSLALSAPEIDTGVAISGESFVGNTPDQGALELITLASATVANATPTVVNLIFNTPAGTGPMIFASNPVISGHTISGSCAAAGSTGINCTVTSAFVNGEATRTVTFTAGNVTNSVLIGLQRESAIQAGATNITNLVGGTAPVLTQTRSQFYLLLGTANGTSTILSCSAESANCTLTRTVRVRLKVKNAVADKAASGLQLYASEDGGAYILVPLTCAASNICMATVPGVTNGAATTERLTTDGTFVAGAVIQDQSATPAIAFANGRATEQEWAVQFVSGLAIGKTFDFRARLDGNVALDTYIVTPRVKIGYAAHTNR